MGSHVKTSEVPNMSLHTSNPENFERVDYYINGVEFTPPDLFIILSIGIFLILGVLLCLVDVRKLFGQRRPKRMLETYTIEKDILPVVKDKEENPEKTPEVSATELLEKL